MTATLDAAGGAAALLWLAERPREVTTPPTGSDPPLGVILDSLLASGWDGELEPPTADRPAPVLQVGRLFSSSPVQDQDLPATIAAEGSAVEWNRRSYVLATWHTVQLRLRPGEELLSALAPPGSGAALPTFALFLELPGWAYKTDAEARSGERLYWAWDPISNPFVVAGASSVQLHPVPAGLAALGMAVFVGGGVVAVDLGWRGRRSKHVRRRRSQRGGPSQPSRRSRAASKTADPPVSP